MSNLLIDPFDLMPKVHAGELKAMRQSTIGNIEVCSMREELRQKYPTGYSSGDARALGTAYHAGLEVYWLARQQGEPVTQEQVHAAIRQSIEWEMEKSEDRFTWTKFHNPEDLAVKAAEMADLTLSTHTQFWGPEWNVLGVEAAFAAPFIDGWVATGTIDLVLSNGLKTVLVDHKTANRMWSYKKHLSSPQPGWYSHNWGLLAEHMGADPGTILMAFEIMTYAGKFDRRWVVPTHRTQMAAVEKANIACQLIENDGPWWPNTSSNLCSETYCDSFAICPHGGELVSIQLEAARLLEQDPQLHPGEPE